MKYSLLLDSSNIELCVALAKGDELFDEISYPAWQKQSEKMIEEIDSILTRNNLTKDDIGAVVVSKGPGSYTGIRVALTIAKTVSFALDCPLYLPSSLEALKDEDKPSICLMNARSKRSYIGVYHNDECLMEDTILDNEKVKAYIADHPDYSVCGDASYLNIESTKTSIAKNLAKLQLNRNLCVEPLGAKPIYLKDSSGDSNMKITVRKMIASDVSSVLNIENSCFGKEAYNEEQIKYDLLENPVSTMLVATVNADVVGFIDFMITFDSATISQIAVDETYRKHGVGNLLLGEMVRICKSQEEEVDNITLEVRESNAVARRFYKRHSFQEITTKKRYYSDGEDAIYMVRSIIND